MTLFTRIAAVFLFLCCAPAMAAETQKPVVVGVISTESAQSLEKQWTPFFEDMESALRIPVKGFFASDYAGIVEGMRFNQVDVAVLGGKSAIAAVDRAGGEVFARIVDTTGYPGYHSVLIVHKDSPIQTLDDVLKSPGTYTFGNGDPQSTSGFLIPDYYVFAANGIDVQKHFRQVTNASHEVNALAVANRRVDVATNNTNMVGDPARAPQSGSLWKSRPEDARNIRVIWTSPLIPAEPVVMRKNLDAPVKESIKTFFYGYGKTPDQKKILAAIGPGIGAFNPSDDDQLAPIRRIEAHGEIATLQKKKTLTKVEQTCLENLESTLSELEGKMSMPPASP